MSFTPEGLSWLARLLAEEAEQACIVVSDGGELRATARASSITPEGGQVTFTATFGEGDANFEWRKRDLVLGNVVIDSEEQDQGRKVTGTIWTVEVTIDLEV